MNVRFPTAIVGTFFCLLAVAAPAAGKELTGAREFLERGYADLAAIIEGPSSPAFVEEAAALIATAFDVDYFCYRIVTERWPRLHNGLRDRLREAVARALVGDIKDFIGETSDKGLPHLRFISAMTAGRLPSGDEAAAYLERRRDLTWAVRGSGSDAVSFRLLRYELEGGGGKKPLVFAVGKYPDGRWRVTDVFSRGIGLAGELRKRARAILHEYSLPFLIAELAGSDAVLLEDWSEGLVGEVPPGWRWREQDDRGPMPYRLQEEEGVRYLAAADRGESVVIGKEVRWNLRKYPYIAFRWRARKLPAGGDESRGETNDSAAGISVVYNLKFGVIPKTVKYVWSSTLPVGRAVRREGVGRPWVVVADSGEERLGDWRSHVFNAYEAYRETFGGEPPRGTVGIGILTDANATAAAAAADYGVITVLKEAEAGSGIIGGTGSR